MVVSLYEVYHIFGRLSNIFLPNLYNFNFLTYEKMGVIFKVVFIYILGWVGGGQGRYRVV